MGQEIVGQPATGISPGSAGPVAPTGSLSEVARLGAQLEAKSEQGTSGYCKGYGAGLTAEGVRTREVCSWLQVPAILQELQLAASIGKPVELRILFPDVGAGATQAEIKKFFQSYHSKKAGEMVAELEEKLTQIQNSNSMRGFDATAFLEEYNNLSRDNASVLSVTDVVDLNSKSLDQKSLIATLRDAAQVAAGRKVALVVEVPSAQAEALAAAIGSLKQSGCNLNDVRIWVGALNHGSSVPQGKKLEELTIDQFLERVAPTKDKDGVGKDDSGGGAPSQAPSSGPSGTGNGNGGLEHGLGRGNSAAAPLSIPQVLKGLEETEQKLIASARNTYSKSEEAEVLAARIQKIQSTYGVLKQNMRDILARDSSAPSAGIEPIDLSASREESSS